MIVVFSRLRMEKQIYALLSGPKCLISLLQYSFLEKKFLKDTQFVCGVCMHIFSRTSCVKSPIAIACMYFSHISGSFGLLVFIKCCLDHRGLQ